MKELESRIKKVVDDSNVAMVVKSVESVNHRPHPYCITDKHLKYNQGMFLGKAQIEEMERKHGPMCGMYEKGDKWYNYNPGGGVRCNKTYDEHTSDTVCFLQLTDNVSQADAQSTLKAIVDELGENSGLDGFAFIETEEKFRIQ